MAKRKQIRQVTLPGTCEPVPVFTTGEPLPDGASGFPKSVRVLGQRYRVVAHSELYNDPRGKVAVYGCVVFEPRVILIESDQPQAHAYRTLAHERGHVYVQDRRERDKRFEKLTPEQEEAVCDLVADVLEDVGALREF